MSLLNLDDLDGVVAEVARILAPGGRFCFTTVHPANSLKPMGGFGYGEGYFQTYAYPETRERGGLRMTFHDTHRPLEAYTGALERAGLLVEALREPRPSEAYVAEHPEVERWTRAPGFLVVRALKPV
jgi:SAM-dependent methyltransferase